MCLFYEAIKNNVKEVDLGMHVSCQMLDKSFLTGTKYIQASDILGTKIGQKVGIHF